MEPLALAMEAFKNTSRCSHDMASHAPVGRVLAKSCSSLGSISARHVCTSRPVSKRLANVSDGHIETQETRRGHAPKVIYPKGLEPESQTLLDYADVSKTE